MNGNLVGQPARCENDEERRENRQKNDRDKQPARHTRGDQPVAPSFGQS